MPRLLFLPRPPFSAFPMVSPTPPLAGPLRSPRRQRRRAAGPSGSWFASLRRGPRTRRMWGGKKRLGLPFRCPSQRFLSRKLDPACWTSHLSPCRGCRRLKGETFSSLLSGTAGLLRISPFFPAPRPPSPPRHVFTGCFLAPFTKRETWWKGPRGRERRGAPEGFLSRSCFSRLPGYPLSSSGDWQQEAMDFPHRSASSAEVFFFGFVSFACSHV